MKKNNSFFILLGIAFLCSSFAIHKFYMAIYQVNYVPTKKRIEITARLFVDDLNVVLEKKYHKKTALGLPNESTEDEALMKKYLSEHVFFKVNGSKTPFQYLSKELQSNVLVCYLKISDVPKITSLEIINDAFIEQFPDQQNLIQSTIYGKKNSLLLTNNTVTGLLK